MLCNRCQQFCEDAAKEIRIPDQVNTETFPDPSDVRWARFSAVLHHNLSQLEAASDQRCPICRIISSEALKWKRPQLPETCTIFLEIESKSGRYPVLSTTLQANGRDLIKRQIAYSFCRGPFVDDELAYTLSKCAEAENDSTGSDASFTLANFWLKRCLEKHNLCSRLRSSQPFMPSRLLDVSDGIVRLIETKNELIADDDKRFIALSHCWGKFQIITTTRGSLESRLKGIQTDQLSRTFLDAVAVTRNLSYRYLWIDSLCIIQDDETDWNKEAAQMCDVYQAADLTILAAHASGGDVGCFRERDGILQLPFILKFPMNKGGDQAKSTVWSIFTQYLSSDDPIDPYPPLYSRAWVLQEQLLSPRKLIFEGARLKWECLCAYESECLTTVSIQQGRHEIVKSSIANGEDFFHGGDYGNPDAYRLWHRLIAEYTARGMTKPSDRLAGIAGIANSIQKNTTNQYLFGLWRERLLSGLMWSIPHVTSRYMLDLPFYPTGRYEQIRHTDLVAPSWSWGSVTAAVTFMNLDRAMLFQHLCKIQEVNVTGTAVRQTGRLQILGHIRVAYVNSVYPYAIQEAARNYANMQCADHRHWRKKHPIAHCGRSFSPEEYFLCSQKHPRRDIDWRLICGCWRPDEVLDPNTEITFIAIGQHHQDGSLRGDDLHERKRPLEVFTLGLVPTGRAANEFRRVGYGVWSGCAWYGYTCSFQERKPYTVNMKSWGWWLFWTAMEKVWRTPPVRGVKIQHGDHENPRTADRFPKKELYHDSIDVRMESVVLV